MTTGCTLGFIPLILSSVEGQCEIVELPDGECLCVDICQGSVGGTGPQGPQGFDGAQGIQGTQGSQGYDGPPGPQGPTGYQGLPGIKGATGTPLGIILEFDDAVAGGVSGSLISFNSVDSTGVSEVWVDNFSKAGQDLTNWINSWYTGWPGPTGYGPYGVLTVQSTLNSDALFNFNITGITYVNAGGLTYFKLACDALYYPGAEIVNFLTDGDDVAITFSKDGPPGPQGFDGAQGIQGTQGSQGHRGDPGFQGAQGIQGHQGYQGYDGDVGPQGPTGFDGAEGIKGSTGIPLGTIMDYVESATGGTADGKLSFNNIDSADISEVWLDDESKYNQPLRDWIDSWYSGFPGATGYGPYGVLNVHSTEAADVLFSFKITDIFDRTTYYRLGCEPLSYPGNTVTDFLTNDDDVAITFSRYGPPGPQGFQGFDGAQGIQGHQGPGGPKGFQGYDGPIGTIGPTGPEGPEGPQGPIGYAGAVGPIGPIGYSGPEGPDGPPGPQGVTGPQGHQGYQGTQGSQGSQGEQGFQGYQGYQGIQGHEGEKGSPLGIIMTFDEAVNGGTADGKLSFNDEHTTPISEVWIDSHSKSLQPLTTWIQSWYSGYPGATGQGPYGVLSVQSTVTSNTLYTFKVTGINALTSYYVIDCDPVYFPGEVVADFLSDGDDVAISFTRYGPPGGPQGAQGSQGQGAQGAQGTDGPQGAQGFQGAQGQGAQGAQGTDGPPGPAGATGLTALAIEARDALWARNTTTGGMISETGCYPFLGSLNNPNSGGGGTGTDEDGNADGYGLSFFEGVTWSYGGDGGEAGTGAWKPTPPIFSRWNDTTAIMNAAWREMSWEDGEMGASLITTLESDVTIKATGLGSIQADQISLASGGYTAVANVPLSEWSASDLDITGKYLTTTNLLVKADSLTVGDACPVPLPFCYMALSAADVASSDEKALGYSNVPTTIESNISDFVWDDTAKNWIVKIAGTYRVIGAVILEGGSSLVNLNVNLEGVSILTGAPRVHSSVDPLEHTIMAVFTAAADDVVNITYEATAASTVKAIIGSTFFMERLK